LQDVINEKKLIKIKNLWAIARCKSEKKTITIKKRELIPG